MISKYKALAADIAASDKPSRDENLEVVAEAPKGDPALCQAWRGAEKVNLDYISRGLEFKERDLTAVRAKLKNNNC